MLKESHPYERNTTFLKPHAVAWERYAAQFVRTARVYVPVVIVFFGWPFAMKYAINSYNGVYEKPRSRR